MLYAPGSGWARAFIRAPGRSHGRYSPLRAIAWPRKDLLIAGGSGRPLATANAEPFDLSSGFDDRADTPRAAHQLRRADVQDTMLAIACTPSDPLDCVAVGLDGLIVRGDGTNWRVPVAARDGAGAAPHITGVAFDGRTPLLATTDGLYVGRRRPAAYVRDDDLRARMTAAGLPAGGAHGRDRRRRRRRRRRPLRARHPRGALAADERAAGPAPVRPRRLPRHGRSRAVDRVRDADLTPLPEPVEPEDERQSAGRGRPSEQGPQLFAPSPTDAVVLRETADGWIDLDRSRFQRSGGRDLPDMTPNTRAILVDADGSGLLLGGVSDASTRPTSATGRTCRPSAAWRRRGGSNAARSRLRPPRPSETGRDVPRRPAPCASPSAAIRRAWTAAAAPMARATRPTRTCRPRSPASGRWSPAAPARRRCCSAAAAPRSAASRSTPAERAATASSPRAPGVPTYVLPGPGDLPGGGAEAFASAFASAPAPAGHG